MLTKENDLLGCILVFFEVFVRQSLEGKRFAGRWWGWRAVSDSNTSPSFPWVEHGDLFKTKQAVSNISHR